MGVTTITPTLITANGVNQDTYMVACNTCGSKYKPHGTREYLRFTNTSAATYTFTIKNQVGGSDIGPITVPITTGEKIIAFYATPTNVNINNFIDADGYVNIEYGATLAATTKAGVFRLP
jgi:hypothetical protein